MRIAMLSWESRHSIWAGGVGVHVTELAQAMQELGHDVYVFTRRAPDQSQHGVVNGVSYHRCDYPPHPDFVEDINSMCRAFVDRVFSVEDLEGPFDVIHAHDWLTANAMIWIRQGRRRASVLTVHSTEYARCGNALPYNGTSERVRYQEWAGADWADRVIAVSGAVRHEIQQIYRVPEHKVAVVYNGVHADRFVCKKDPGELKRGRGIGPTDPTVLFCGRMSYHKGPDLLLEAVPGLLRFHPRASFVFVGEGEMRQGLEERTRRLNVGHAVRWLGRRDGAELRELYHMADAVCVPSRNEPFGIVVLEAWSVSKPVVVTQIGGPGEYVQHNVTGLHVYPHPDSIGWGLGTLFMDWPKAREMGQEGRRAATSRFSWDIIAGQVLEVYEPAVRAVAGDHAQISPPSASRRGTHATMQRSEPANASARPQARPLAFSGGERRRRRLAAVAQLESGEASR